MTHKHTPGPWRICDGFSGIDARIIDAGPHTSDIAWIPCSADDDPEKVRDANTRLIADAPELLDVCRELLGPMIVWSQYWASTYNGGKLSPAHEEIIQRASVVIARNTPQEDTE